MAAWGRCTDVHKLIGALGARLLAALIVVAATVGAASAQNADLVVNQSDSPDPGPAGAVFTYTVRVDNNGPNAATGVVLTDTLPAGAIFVGAVPTQGSCSQSSGVVTCPFGGIAFLASATVTVQVQLPAAGVYTNSATASASTSDPNASNNNGITEDTTAQNAADMTLTVVDAPDPVASGQPYGYTVTAVNHGPNGLAASDQQIITFTVPAGATITALPTGTGWSCTASGAFPLSSGSVTCTRTAALANGASAPALTVNAVANVGGTITAAFQVSSTLPDGNPADNTVIAQTTSNAGSSDVSITKTASPSTVALGSNVTYTITPRLNGGEAPGTAPPGVITVTDTLASGLTFVSAGGTGWTCGFAAPTVTCTRPGPYAGGNFTNMPAISLVATVSAIGSIANTAVIAIPETDPVPANNSASVSVTGSNSADLTLTKTASLQAVVPNQDFTYSVIVRNLGPVGVGSGNVITVMDVLDPNLVLRAAPTGTGWSCLPSAGFPIPGATVTCTRPGPLASAASAPTITIPVRATSAAAIANSACVALSGTGPSDSNAANDCGSVNVSSTATQADLRVLSKTASPNPVLAGQDLTYTITVTNQGPDPATNVTITDTLASLVTAGGFQSATPSQGSCTPSTVAAGPSQNLSCNLGTMAMGDVATISVVVRPTIVAIGNRSNTATITSPDIGDPDRTNNTASVTSTVTAVADMQVTKTATPNPVRAGTPLTYVVTARNNGPSTAQAVTVTDNLPSNAAFVQMGAISGGGSCTAPAAGTIGGAVTCSWTTIANAAQQTATLIVRPLTGAAGGTVDNTATVATTTVDTNAGNNTTTVNTPVTTAQLDVLVNKVDSVDPVALGQSTTYTVTVTNAGPSFGTNVVLVDNFPTGSPTATFSYRGSLTINPPGIGSCVEPGIGVTSGTLTCTFPGLANGQSAIVTYDMRAESIAAGVSGTSFNTATVTVSEPDSLPANNTSTNATTSRRTADLELVKSAPASTTPGASLAYSLAITNHGPNDSVGAVVTDALPAGVSFVSASPGCTFSAGTVTCTLGTLTSGASTAFSVTVHVSSPYTGASPLVNTASVAAINEVDPVSGNNSSTASTTMGAASADVYVVKGGPFTVVAGGALSWTLTMANNGPSGADGTTFVDTLPPGVTGVTASCGNALGGAACPAIVVGAGVVTGTISTFPAGGSLVVTINSVAPASGTLTNVASVAPPVGMTDPAPVNNESQATTVVVAPPDLTIAKSHFGSLVAGQTARYTLGVSNVGGSSTSGLITVTDTLPAGLTATAIDGAPGWSCTLVPLGCTRSDVLGGGGAFESIGVTVDVSATASGTLVNVATVSGGGDTNPANNTSSDPATVVAGADLVLVKTHTGGLSRGAINVPYALTVSNHGASDSRGPVAVVDALPAGLTARSIVGAGWSCVLATVTCTRNDALASGASYPVITLLVDVSRSAPSSLVNTASVSGGGDVDPTNNSGSDPALLIGGQVLEPIPALENGALAVLVLLLALMGTWRLRRLR